MAVRNVLSLHLIIELSTLTLSTSCQLSCQLPVIASVILSYVGLVMAASEGGGDLATPRPMVGVVQMNSTPDKERNFSQAKELIQRAKHRGVQVCLLNCLKCLSHGTVSLFYTAIVLFFIHPIYGSRWYSFLSVLTTSQRVARVRWMLLRPWMATLSVATVSWPGTTSCGSHWVECMKKYCQFIFSKTKKYPACNGKLCTHQRAKWCPVQNMRTPDAY